MYDTEAEEIESITEDTDDMDDLVYLDVNDHKVKVPKELIKYLDGGILGLS